MTGSPRAGFWKRAVALAIDALIVGAVLIIASSVLRNVFLRLGENLWYIGFILFGIYLVLLNSSVGKGQTLGKKMLGIRVVQSGGKMPTLSQSLWRYILMGLIMFSGGIGQSIVSLTRSEYAIIPFRLLVLMLFLGIVGLLAFTKSKRGLHDYLTGTAVVQNSNPNELSVGVLESMRVGFAQHKIVIFSLGATGLVLALMGIFLSLWFLNSSIGSDLLTLKESLDQSGLISNVGVRAVWSYSGSNDQASSAKNLVIEGYISFDQFSDAAKLSSIEQQIKERVFSTYPQINTYDNLNVVLRNGYNIGIGTFYFRHGKIFPVK